MWKFAGFTLFYFFINFYGINAQLSLNGCPVGWETHDTNCYKFENEDTLFFEEADAACWNVGATLLRITNYNEHKFVSDFLMLHDFRSIPYFTSGYYFNKLVGWDTETFNNPEDNTYWVNNSPPPQNTKYFRIAYVRGGTQFNGYGWEVVSSSVPAAYICEISKAEAKNRIIEDRDYSYGLGGTNLKEIKLGPHIYDQPDNMLVYPFTPSAYLDCKSNGNPNPTYGWQRDGNNTITSRVDDRYTLSAGRLTIQNPQEQGDFGSYQCLATNEFGTVVSDPARIEFGYLQGFSPVRPEDVRANKFEGTRISCNTPPKFPDARYSWFFNSIQDPIFKDHGNMFVSRSGYLYFSSVQPTDSRLYFCTVTLAPMSGFKTATSQPPSAISLGVRLIVLGTEHGYFKPFLYTHVFPSPALRGATIRIECIAYGSLPLRYTWKREDGQGLEAGTTISDHNRVITIINATLQAEGNYICMVDGRGGVTRKTVSLTVEAKPYFPFGIGDRLADPGQRLKWRCKAVARPEATYTWYKNGKQMVTIPGQIEIKKGYLLFLQVNKERDEGMYQCGASNVHGTTYNYGQLKVLLFSPTFDRNPIPAVTTIPQGGNFTIPCPVEAAPLPDVTWLKNGGSLGVMPGDVAGRLGMTLDYSLVLNGIELSDSGYYTCKAVNSEGEASNSTRVNVVANIMIQRRPTDQEVQVNRTAFMYCQASYNSQMFDIAYTWKLNGHNIDLEDSSHYIQSKRDGLDGLYIRNAQFKNDGRYTCEARTTIHVVRANAYLRVNGPPGPPAGVYVKHPTVTSYSCKLIWTIVPPMFHGNAVTRYDVEAQMSIREGQWKTIQTDVLEHIAANDAIALGLRDDQRSITVEGLLPDISYSFRVRAINDYGKGHEASKGSVSIKTPSTAPVVAPRNIRGLDEGKVGTLNIMWDPLDISEYCGPGVGYNIYFRKKDDVQEFHHEVVEGAQSELYTHLVGLENYYLEYSVKIGAFNNFGAGPNSTENIVMSAEGMPMKQVVMGGCDNYNGTAFSLTWTPVEDTREIMKGRLKGYRIRYWHIDDPDFVVWYDLYGQHDNRVIFGLSDNTNYWASVQVLNYAGVGPIGEERLAETFHLPPREYPRHVKVWPHTKHAVRVTWQGIMTDWDEEVLQGYILRVWKVQEDIRTATDIKVDKVNEAYLTGLQTKTVYVLRVLGFSIGGDGALSPHVYFTVQGTAVPFDPTTTRFCFNHHMCDAASSVYSSIFTLIMCALTTLVFKIFA